MNKRIAEQRGSGRLSRPRNIQGLGVDPDPGIGDHVL